MIWKDYSNFKSPIWSKYVILDTIATIVKALGQEPVLPGKLDDVPIRSHFLWFCPGLFYTDPDSVSRAVWDKCGCAPCRCTRVAFFPSKSFLVYTTSIMKGVSQSSHVQHQMRFSLHRKESLKSVFTALSFLIAKPSACSAILTPCDVIPERSDVSLELISHNW